ncbi:epidermal growth factor receptor kinase substrate 8-like protein 1 isoform X1 [Ascaphus truei]|uniref:epidermal growth factor receptor kinase substrate 8-like protein 1 isoform X1 n=3 Tax=Ascaphus truei TaxID=8439 RepID=UPI003F5A86E7
MINSESMNGISKPTGKSIYEQRKKYSNVIMADVSQYQVNHLVTLTIDEDDDVHTVEDAIRKLAAMDAKGKIWTQEMLLQVNSSSVKLLDVETKEELEVFLLLAIQRCDTVLPEKRVRGLLVLVCQDKYQPKADVHFFQCDEVGAELIKEDINSAVSDLKSGNNSKRPETLRYNKQRISQQSTSGAYTFSPLSQGKQPHTDHASPAAILEREAQRRPTTLVKPPRSSLNPQIVVTSTPQVEQSTNIPQEPQYSQVQQQNKTQLILPSPGSPQMQQKQGHDSMSQTIVREGAPQDPMSARAGREVDLLNHCFDDIEFFMGNLQKSAEAYKVLDQRKKSRRTKRKEAGEGLLTLRSKPPKMLEYTDIAEKFKYSFCLLARMKSNIINPSAEELIHFLFGPLKTLVDSSGGVELAAGITSPMLTKEAVTLLKECLDDKELELWSSLGPNWTKPRVEFPRDFSQQYNPTFRSGWVPSHNDGQIWEDPIELQHRHEELRSQQSAPQIDQPHPPPALNGHQETDSKRVNCTYDFVARNSSELSVLQGEMLEVVDDSKKWWKVQNRFGQIGYVPYNILAPITAAEPNDAKENGAQTTSPSRKAQPPPTPPKKPTSVIARSQRDMMDGPHQEQSTEQEKVDRINSMNEELLLRLASGRTAPQKTFSVQRMSDTSIPLTDESSAPEVTAWLRAKGFSTLTINSLGVLNGAQLFSLRKDEFRAVSPEEGARVYSQIMVQKSLLEDSKKISELEAVMVRQKKKVDTEIEQGSL